MKLLLTLTSLTFLASLHILHAQTFQTIPPTINISKFAGTKTYIEGQTANATGVSTFWKGNVTVSSSGIITGNGTIETFSANGTSLGQKSVSISSGSKIWSPSSTAGNISSSNLRTINNEIINAGDQITKCADYVADVLVKYNNRFVARGKVIYRYRMVYEDGGRIVYDDSYTDIKISLTGSGGHLGSIYLPY
jgi:hypothetical protein